MNTTAALTPPIETHPEWCGGYGLDVNCGGHLSDPVGIPATAGRYVPDSGRAAYPMASVCAELRPDGTSAVCVTLTGRGGEVEASFRESEVDQLLAALAAKRDQAKDLLRG